MVKASGQSKGSRGPSSGVRLRLKMATFCKSISLEPETQEITLIGILPGMIVEVRTLTGTEKGPFNPQFPLWVYALFAVENPASESITETIEGTFTLDGKNPMTNQLEIHLKPSETRSSINIRCVNTTGIPVMAGPQTFLLTLKHNGHEVGTADLPIMVKVSAIDGMG